MATSAAPPGTGSFTLTGADEAYIYTAIQNATSGGPVGPSGPSGPFGDINASFTLTSAYLVFFMHCGFAMISIGCVRARFAKHIAMLVLIDACASALGFYLTGYAFGFGDNQDANGFDNGNPFIGTRYFALHNLNPALFYEWVFQWSFAATACTIVSGAIAERARLEAYIMYSFFMASWVYPILVHSVWSQAGWASMFRQGPHLSSLLFTSGAIDFAGSGAVHMVGGYAALAGCAILGPRIGRFNPDGTVNTFSGHNSSLFVLGVMILWFGWYGFNPGSQQAIIGFSSSVGTAAVTTTLAPASAGMSALTTAALIGWIEEGVIVYDIMTMGNGTLAGLVAITSGCSTVQPWAAVIIGIVAGALYCIGSRVSILCKLDDPLDAIAVHAWNGTWGVLAVGLFANKKLIFNAYGPNPRATGPDDPNFRHFGAWEGGHGYLLAAQCVYLLWLAGWVLGMMIPFFGVLKLLGLFRVPPEVETIGLDISHHGGSAYPGGPEEMYDKSVSGGNPSKSATLGDLEAIRAEMNAMRAAMNKQIQQDGAGAA